MQHSTDTVASLRKSVFVNGYRYVVRTLRGEDGRLVYYVQDTWQGYCTDPTIRKQDAQTDARTLNRENEAKWA